MKKLITLLFVIMVMFVVGCGSDTPKNTNNETPQSAPAVDVNKDNVNKQEDNKLFEGEHKYPGKKTKLSDFKGDGKLHQFTENKK